MYLASEIIFEFVLAYFILFLAIFGINSLLVSNSFYFYMYMIDIASKSLKQARNIGLLSHFMSKGLIKLNFA